MNVVTIGAYGFSEEAFFRTLQAARVDLFCDIRWRRGVRGATYAFANSQRLQSRLAELEISYLHRKALAPSPAVRRRQSEADKAEKVAKRQRTRLGAPFIQAYGAEVLAHFDPEAFAAALDPEARVLALFCVERAPEACHRMLVAETLETSLGWKVEHLVP